MSDGYLRCRHCKGFYETSFEKCKWCNYETPVLAADGKPKIYPDRETCRAIQLAEYEQLPQEARDDPMGPPEDEPDLKCGCLHCGEEGHIFEAIEMRWIVNERMWACPCTTCGGRGYEIDIHEIDPRWECVNCGHKYKPADGRFVSANCKCPKCGCTDANGWHDDEFDEDDFDENGNFIGDEFDDEDEDDADETFDDNDFNADLNPFKIEGPDEAIGPDLPALDFKEDLIPWEDEVREWKPGDDEADDDEPRGEISLPDDIDFPRTFEEREDNSGGPAGDEDLPF